MKIKPTLLILAAGMGSRYGALKQLDEVGPSGEAIIDYSLYDAINAGFGKVVFVIRKELEEEFRKRFDPILKDRVPYEFAYQELDMLPAGYQVPEGRQKPWGTAHAVWCARSNIQEPFAVINADDFYGKDAYAVLADAMSKDQTNHYMVAYYLKNTLSLHGNVSRGVCQVQSNGFLKDVTEHTKISLQNGNVFYEKNGEEIQLAPDLPVSMNFWGFQPSYFDWLDELLADFLDKSGQALKSEYFIPTVVNALIKNGHEGVKVLKSSSQWFGITYREDKQTVISNINSLINQGEYPENLWAG